MITFGYFWVGFKKNLSGFSINLATLLVSLSMCIWSKLTKCLWSHLNEVMYYIGVDVGTHSVRAGLFDSSGEEIKTASVPITTYKPYPNVFEQSAMNIWNSCASVIQMVTADVQEKKDVQAIGFDATCSLVAVGADLKPLSLSVTGKIDNSVILWMDHRAVHEAEIINALDHQCLEAVGGKISPEMQPPKLMWLKKNLPSQWDNVKYFFDLPDFLTWKATGSLSRSTCSLVCKWLYQSNKDFPEGWVDDFWKKIGLADILHNNYEKIGAVALSPGTKCGCLTTEAAMQFGLLSETVVATSIIDAYAGAVGILACHFLSIPREISIENRIALVCGTSTCLIKIMKSPISTPGIWGPYYSVIFPNLWCCEAGQSATGYLIDHIINTHPAASQLMEVFEKKRHISDTLNDKLNELQLEKCLTSVSYLTADLHVYPDYHGNRSPLADSNLKGMVSGLTLSTDIEALAKQYLATIQSLAYSTRHILSCLIDSGHNINTLLVCGGLANNPLYIKMHADVTGLPVIIPQKRESVLLGAAMLSTVAAGHFNLERAMGAMSGSGTVVQPSTSDKSFHDKKYCVFLEMLSFQNQMKEIMK